MNYSIFLIVVLTVALAFMVTNMTGYLVAGDNILTKIWDFSNLSEYVYNSSLIDLSSGVKLKANITVTEYTSTEITQYSVAKAYYDPSDKIDKLIELDDSNHEAKENKIFDIVFSSPLNNGDVVSFYLKKENAIKFHLCDVSEFCDFPGYGNASYGSEEDGWVNITLSGLESPSSIFNVNTDDNIKVDYIVSSSTIIGTYYDPSDKTSKVNEQDEEKLDVNKNKILNMFFNGSLDDSYVVSFYLKGDKESEVVLCDLYLCSEEYASFSYPGEEGWYNTTLQLDSPINHFSVDGSEEIKIDYISAAYYNQTSYNVTNTTYPESASIETQDLSVQNIKSWGSFSKSKSLNNQSISYQYSTDSGLTWYDIDDLSTTSNTIRFKATLNSNTTDTPVLNSLSLDYIASSPIFGKNNNIKASPGDIINISLNITNPLLVSNVTAYIKYTNGTVLNQIVLEYNNETDLFEGIWGSESFSGLYYIDAEIKSDYSDTISQRQLLSLISSASGSLLNSSIQLTKNQTLTINSKETTNTILDITPLNDVINATLSIVEYSENIKANNPKTSLGKYIDIVADDKLKANLSKATMTIYYSDSEIQNAGIDESSLKIHYFNDTSGEWEVLNSIVNTTGNYLVVSTTHFSTYGIFGDVQSSGSSSSSGGSGGGSGGSSRSKPIVNEVIQIETTSLEAYSKPEANTDKCYSDISVYLEDSKLFIKNSGSCVLKNVTMKASSHLLEVVKIPNNIESIEPGEKEYIDLGQSNLVILNPITGLAIASSEIYGGEILIAFVEDGVEKEKKLPVNIKVNKTENPDMLLTLVAIVLVVSFYFLAKKSVKSSRKKV